MAKSERQKHDGRWLTRVRGVGSFVTISSKYQVRDLGRDYLLWNEQNDDVDADVYSWYI